VADLSKSYFIFDHVADECASGSIARLRQKLVAMMPSLEWAFLLDVGKVVFHSNSVMRAIHCTRTGRKGNRRNEVVMVVPTPAACGGAAESDDGGGGTR
jgi:hypothetical protein